MGQTHEVLTDDQIESIVKTLKNARYDRLTIFFEELSAAFINDATKDMMKNRTKLANCLDRMGIVLFPVREECAKAWHICEPRMRAKYK